MMVSISGMAQSLLSKLPANVEKARQISGKISCKKMTTAAEKASRGVKPAKASALSEVPSTAQKIEGLYIGDDFVYGAGTCMRIEECDYYIDGDTVYLPNPVYASYGNKTAYLKGALDSSTGAITVEPGQVVVENTESGAQLVAYIANQNTAAAETTQNITYWYDSEDNSISLDEDVLVGFYSPSDLTADGLANFILAVAYGPMSIMPAITSWGYAYKDTEGYDKTSTLQMMSEEGVYIMKGLMPAYADRWLYGICTEVDTDNDLYLPSGQVLKDDVAFCAGTLSGSDLTTIQYIILYNDSVTNTYSSAGDSVIMDFFVTESSTYGNSCLYSDLVLTAPSAGINSAKAGNGKAKAVQTQYYDLLGRRINGRHNGVCIKQTRYADGTTKAVKVVK